MKILVLATNYSRPDGFVSLQYIHSRNIWYLKKGIDVSVISFGAKYDYVLNGVKVYTPETYKSKLQENKYDILISHAPNLRNHYKFLKKYIKQFNNVIFFFHGHEVLRMSKVYPKPYAFDKKESLLSGFIRDIYDRLKLYIWRSFFGEIAYKSQFVFVSSWMYNMFIKHVKIDPEIVKDRKHVIYNCIGEMFENTSYEEEGEKYYDFITIRNDLDGSKYGIDIVTRIAENNPQYKFCVVGEGEFYKYNKKPDNLEWINRNLMHGEIIDFLNKSKCALLPTRTDAQGVMACEMATFGIPLITSNIDVCKEVFSDFENVELIDNNKENVNVSSILKRLESADKQEKVDKYFAKNTVGRELELFKRVK